ncbi:MAG: HK97 gp10 family phage protein [Patescibacteria group bacterium]|nr:HK97 gp10 family phage protein [Patescibacteria group bacterium]
MSYDFVLDVTNWTEQQRAALEAAPQLVAEEVKNRIQELTPVETGRLRASWQVVVEDDEHISIETNVEYARRINYGFIGTDSLGRHYDQLGHHMVEQAAEEAPGIASNVWKALQDKGGPQQ